MHEIALSSIKTSVPFRFGLTKVDQRKNESTRFRKGTDPAQASVLARLCVPTKAVLALLLPVVAERGCCDPTWVVQAGSCGGVAAIAERSRARRGATVVDAPCVVCK